jgi:hypothetical protein
VAAIARTVVVALLALAWLMSGVGNAAADATIVRVVAESATGERDRVAETPPAAELRASTSSPLGTDSRGSIITAAVVGLSLGAAIAFWQSRRHRRKYRPYDEPPPPPEAGP